MSVAANRKLIIKISNDDLCFDEETIIQQIKSIPQIITTYTVDVESIKSKDNGLEIIIAEAM